MVPAFPAAPAAVLLRTGLCGLALCLLAVPAAADVPTKPAERAALVSQPTALIVQPATITLVGPRAMQQLVVTGRYADGTVRDLTSISSIAVQNKAIVTADASGWLVPKTDGRTVLTVQAGGQTVQVPVVVRAHAQPTPISFRHELIAALSVGGCNQGACHGTPSGKNGFKLSLRGYDPAADYLELTRDVLGRRTDRLDPDASLILQKALGRIPHEGGKRFGADTVPARIVRGWIAGGLHDDPPTLPKLQSIDVLPGARVLHAPARWQQLAVQAHFSDGTVRDVTRLSVFSSSDPGVAMVSTDGLVEFHGTGEIAVLCRYLDLMQTVRLTYLEPKKGFHWNNPPANNYVDKFVFAKLRMLNILPSNLCTDSEFIRRATMDICGVLPKPAATRAFLASKDPHKRAKLIDSLLERPEYADFWTLKWSDVFRSNRKTIQEKGTHVFQEWLRHAVAHNTPFDAVVRDLLTAGGSTYRHPAANYYRIVRDPQGLAETTAQLFCGIRLQCAKCHNHPFERWTQDDYYSFAAFFARVRAKPDPTEPGASPQKPGGEIIYVSRSGEVVQPRTNQTMKPKFMGGPVPRLAPREDRREALAEWLTGPHNPFFAKSVVNRIWFHLNRRGIVDPVDDFRDSNPSANDELLDALANDFAAHHFDVKRLIRTICNSRTYQLSAATNAFNADDSKYFSHAETKLYTAEQLLDAICTVTEVPEKYPGEPVGVRAMQLPDGDANNAFLKTFGQPGRELACECERESDSNLAQALQLINGPTVHDKVRSSTNRLGRLLREKKSDQEILNELYLTMLARQPSADEVKVVQAHLWKARDRRQGWEDVLWALLNAKEFLFRH